MSKKILVVDDSMNAREMTMEICRPIGEIDFVEAEDGEHALEQLENMSEIPSLIICDQNMPEMKGLELLTVLKERDVFKDIPFIFATSEHDDDLIVEALGKGADEYITKPIDEELLIKKVKGILK